MPALLPSLSSVGVPGKAVRRSAFVDRQELVLALARYALSMDALATCFTELLHTGRVATSYAVFAGVFAAAV